MADSKIKISNGELLDRISILELKMLRVEDPAKLASIKREFYELNPVGRSISLFSRSLFSNFCQSVIDSQRLA